MQDAMQRCAPLAASMPELPADGSNPSDTSLQFAACAKSSAKSKATGHKPCTLSPELAEDENGLSTSSQDPDTLLKHDNDTDEATVDPKKPARPEMGAAMVRAAG